MLTLLLTLALAQHYSYPAVPVCSELGFVNCHIVAISGFPPEFVKGLQKANEEQAQKINTYRQAFDNLKDEILDGIAKSKNCQGDWLIKRKELQGLMEKMTEGIYSLEGIEWERIMVNLQDAINKGVNNSELLEIRLLVAERNRLLAQDKAQVKKYSKLISLLACPELASPDAGVKP